MLAIDKVVMPLNFRQYRAAVQALPHGKRLPSAIYFHRDQVDEIAAELREIVQTTAATLELDGSFNIIKCHLQAFKLSFLSYPDFWTHAHPKLNESVIIDLGTGHAKRQHYADRPNPPILHRKETFLPSGHPARERFAALTGAEERAGLLIETNTIGFEQNWLRLLKLKGLRIVGHDLAIDCADPAKDPSDVGQSETPEGSSRRIDRHLTALGRSDLSAPVKAMIELGLLRSGRSFFDYGCGRGGDVKATKALGFDAEGWDPNHRPEGELRPADVVNLGFVLNVIEDPVERVEALARAWSLAGSVLVVSTLVAGRESPAAHCAYRDGFVTSRNTFQKYFDQMELVGLMEMTLHIEPVPLGIGMVAAFRDDREREEFVARRYRRSIDWRQLSRRLGFAPPPRARRDIYAEHKELLDDFWQTMLELGRLPAADEHERFAEVRAACRSMPEAQRLFVARHGDEAWGAARDRARDDLLVYLALAQLDRKQQPFNRLPKSLQRAIQEFYGHYRKANEEAMYLLHGAGSPADLEIAIEELDFGWLDSEQGHFTIHRGLVDRLPAVLRVYIGCGARLFGDPREADLIKIHLQSGKLSLTYYQDFLQRPFPEMHRRVKIDFRRLFVHVFEHPPGPDRQVLFFKERFLAADVAGRALMEQTSRRLRKLGLNETNVGHGAPVGQWRAFLDRRGLDPLLRRRPDQSMSGKK